MLKNRKKNTLLYKQKLKFFGLSIWIVCAYCLIVIINIFLIDI